MEKKEKQSQLPVVAIVGRPNVGKSTLFNRLVGERLAIVDDQPGVTRDRHYGETEWSGRSFTIVDTGGYDFFADDDISASIRDQAGAALREADLVLFVVDAVEGLAALDEELARTLRAGSFEKVLLLANKVDHPGREAGAMEFYRLGVDRVFPVSAEHGIGLDEVLDSVVEALPPVAAGESPSEAVRVALVGRPNVGKSSLVNAILGEDRVLVDGVPGTTRDAVDTAFSRAGEEWVLVDTAGIRRRGKVDRGVEKYSVIRAVRSIKRADVCCLVLDADEMVTDQDAHIGGEIADAGKGCVIVVNKWDLVKIGSAAGDEYILKVRESLKHLSWAPILFVSALTGRSLDKLLDLIRTVYLQCTRSIPTPELNAFFRRVVNEYKPPTLRGKTLSLGYITQEKTGPPTFAVLVNDPKRVHFSYSRYLENRLRDEYGLNGTAIKLRFKAKKGSFSKNS